MSEINEGIRNIEIERVAKFGGTSMARPDLVAEQLAYPGNEAEVVVVSAPAGLTDAIHGLMHTIHPTVGQAQYPGDLLREMAAICDPSGTNEDIQTVIEDMSSDMDEWRRNGDPVEGLGEYWSAKMFAAYTGSQFVDACDVIRFDHEGQLDMRATRECARRELGDGDQYVVPGYYGSDDEDRVHLLDRSGSDISAALLAHAVDASRLDIWSDVPGFMTADPAIVSNARQVSELTPREARAMYPSCELLHRDVLRFAGRTGVAIYMRNTFGGPDNVGTIVHEERDCLEMPIIGITGMDSMTGLNLYKFGSEERSGSMTDAFETLARWGVPIEDMATDVDDLFVTFQDRHQSKLVHGFLDRISGYGSARLRSANYVRIVGEGLARPGNARTQMLEATIGALARAGIDVPGLTGAPDSVSRTCLIEGGEEVVDAGINAVHAELLDG